MKNSQYAASADSKNKRTYLCSIFPLLGLVFFLGIAFIAPDSKEISRWVINGSIQSSTQQISGVANIVQEEIKLDTKCDECCSSSSNSTDSFPITQNLTKISYESSEPKPNNTCENKCRPAGSESLPQGIVAATSNFEMRPLWGFPKKNENSMNLLAMPVGIKQKVLVNKMVEKFLASGSFVVMLFHYDGVVDTWKEFKWHDRVVHVSALSQTKWWFAKRFLHPNIVAEYDYIFIWDEDLGLEHFDPKRYLAIVRKEGLEISQPGLDPTKSEMHHLITVRKKKSVFHRRAYKAGGEGIGCNDKSTAPPCTGWIEVMAPVFSRAAWRCVWHMVQNDLIHAWGLDLQLGYCAQGERMQKVGVVDSEFVVHHGFPTLGGTDKTAATTTTTTSSRNINIRVEVRRQSFIELDIFKKRWKKAVDEDQCWVDPYGQNLNNTLIF